MNKKYTGRKAILEGVVELLELELMPENLVDMMTILPDDFTAEDTMEIADNGTVELRVMGLIIRGGPDPEPCDNYACNCRNHMGRQ